MACLVQNTTPVPDSPTSVPWSPLYGGGSKLDQDAIQIIHCIYCKDCRMEKQEAERARLAGGEPGTSSSSGATSAATTASDQSLPHPPSSPHTLLEEISLQQTMDKNKESLKRKLMLRRSVNELVDRGIYPPLKTPPAYAEQRKQLERAKTGDLLRHKIQSRPDRQSLVQQHILEDTKIDPSLHERQRLLKKARLTDGLNTKLANRPGPLELVEGNILKTNTELVEAIKVSDDPFFWRSTSKSKDGSLLYSRTSEMEDIPMQPQHFLFDEESISDGVPSPPQDESSLSDISSPSSMPPPAPELPISFTKSPPAPPIITKTTPSILSSHPVTSPKNGNSSSNGNNKSRPKKSKPKTAPKAKVIKFHEYKGPPNVVKSQQNTQQNNNNETPYHVMLQQQQLFLQWQLEFQQKNLPLLLPTQKGGELQVSGAPGMSGQTVQQQGMVMSPPMASTAPKSDPTQTIVQASSMFNSPQQQAPQIKQEVIQQISQPPSPIIQTHTPPQRSISSKAAAISAAAAALPKLTGNLEELKVADLKAELKKRNLPVSGSKPQLIERLKPYTEVAPVTPSPPPPPPPPPMSPANSPNPTVTISLQSPQSLLDSNVVSPPPPPMQTVNAILNVQPLMSNEEANIISPPTSPPEMESTLAPMSPDSMEVSASNVSLGQLKTQTSIGYNSIPMAMDQSRPPSVVSVMQSDVAPMDVDQQPVSEPITLPSLSPTVQMQIQQAQLQQLQKTQLQLQHLQQLQQLQQIQQAQNPNQSTAQQVTQDDILRQQQKHIEELQRQLQESQIRLQLQQLQQAQLQQQNQQLLQSAVQSTASPTPVMNTIQISLAGNNKQNQQTLPTSTAKPIQIPAQLLQNAQTIQTSTPQGLPAVIVTNSLDAAKKQKQGLPDILKTATLHDSLNLGKNKVSSAPVNMQPFILTTTAKTTTTVIPQNGPGQTSVAGRPPSLPNSPLDGQKVVTRSSSSPFFIPMKEPPKYDDAIKQMHNHSQSSRGSSPNPPDPTTISHKSPMMDDVLEILIRHGDLPPSAATEPLLTPKKTEAMPIPPISAPISAPAVAQTVSSIPVFSSHNALMFSKNDVIMSNPGATHTVTVNSIGSPTDFHMSTLKHIKKEVPDLVAPVVVSPPLPPCTVDHGSDLLDLTEMLGVGMDWSSDHTFSGLDLTDTHTPVSLDRLTGNDKVLLSVPSSSNGAQKAGGSTHGSEPDLASLGLNDNDASSNMQIDVSDWLDVIVPSTGLTPLSTNAPVSFSSDPILTPKTQQEVLDLFNFEETDFSNPSDSHCGLNWDKLTEPGTSSS